VHRTIRHALPFAAIAVTVALTQPAAALGGHWAAGTGGPATTRAGSADTHPAAAKESGEASVKVMTYNILELSNDGRREGNGHIAAWSKRRIKAAALVRQATPDVIAIEEAASWVGAPRGPRQVDSMRSAIGGSYRLARTEIPPNQPHYFRTGVYIIYNNATFRPIGKGNHFALGLNRFGVYQEFASRATGARFLFVATHLLVGYGRTDDLTREAETTSLIARGASIAAKRHIPVIYAGDFNSANTHDRRFTLNGAGVAMNKAHAKDAFVVAKSKTNASYNSANGYFRKAPRHHDDIDHIYAPPAVHVVSAGLVLDLRHGRFVGTIPSDHNPLVARLTYSD
jgi:endonuclease/exonuclease/phosphatase family metal-dependent hydrolase